MFIHVNTIESLWDNRVQPLETTWDVFCDAIMEGHAIAPDRSTTKLFNAVEYKPVDDIRDVPGATVYERSTNWTYTRRLQDNVLAVHMLVLDYDGGLSLESARDKFKGFSYVGYTSYGHRKDHGVDKFRIVLPLATPIPSIGRFSDCDDLIDGSAWHELELALKNFAGPCDPASFRCNQFFYLPVAPQERRSLAHAWSNVGNLVDWTAWSRKPADGPCIGDKARSSIACRSTRTLDPNLVLRTQQRQVRVRDVVGKLEGVWCPFHSDRNGSEFVRRVPDSGNVFLFCRKCNQTYFMASKIASMDQLVTTEPLLSVDTPDPRSIFADPTDRAHVDAQLEEIRDSILHATVPGGNSFVPREVSYPTHLVYMPEGTGKSRMAFDVAASGAKVLFACKSLDQVFAKYEEFCVSAKRLAISQRKAADIRAVIEPNNGRLKIVPINVVLLLSKGAKARRRFGVNPVREPPNNPYDVGNIDDGASIDAFTKANPNLSDEFIRVSWRFFGPDRMHFGRDAILETNEQDEIEEVIVGEEKYDSADIIVTTFAQARLLGVRNQYLPLEWIGWFDDPDITDFSDIEPYDPERWGEFTEDEERAKGIVKRHTSGQKYFKRERFESLGAAVRRHKCVYTTTERMTLRAAKIFLDRRNEYVIVHDKMEGVAGGKISILGTQAVYSSFDGIIPLMIRRLEKQKHDILLIADGLGQSFNHVNTKGMNDLKNQDIVVEISAPHPGKVLTICDALGLDFKASNREVARDLMLDQLHQALGRNSGYRFKGSQCVALVPANQHALILSQVRYNYDERNSVLIDRTAGMSRNDRRTQTGPSDLVLAIEQFLNNFEIYIQDKRKVLPDVTYVLEQVQDDAKRISYASRLLHSLTSLSTIRFDRTATDEERSHRRYSDYQSLVDKVLDAFPGDDHREQVFTQYRRRLGITANDQKESSIVESEGNSD